MTLEEAPPDGGPAHVDFGAPAVLRKWPSLNNERRIGDTGPYLLVECTPENCMRELLAKPAQIRHLYEIHTAAQPPLVKPGEIIVELARLRDFLCTTRRWRAY